MSNLYYAALYKNKIIDLLLRSKNLIPLINPSENIYHHIFDYDFTDDSTAEQKTFIIVDTDIDTVKNNIYTDYNLYIYIFTAKELVQLTIDTSPTVDEVKNMGYFAGQNANRIDILCAIVDEILNGTDEMEGIGTVEPAPSGYITSYKPNKNYYGKCLKYHISNLNMSGDTNGNQ